MFAVTRDVFVSYPLAARTISSSADEQVLHRLNIPVLYILHDPREAELIGDAFTVMYDGKLKTIGTTKEAFGIIRAQVLAGAGIV